jgi:oligopeptide transport system substrate-binding protein
MGDGGIMRRGLICWLILVVLVPFVAACGSQGGRLPAATPTPLVGALPTPVIPAGAGGDLIMTLGARDPTTLDPALVGDTTSSFVVRQLFSGLVKLDADLNVQPDLADTWDVSEDGLVYTFELNPHARFADGTPITAEDVQYSLERTTDPNLARFLPARTYLSDIVGVQEKLAGQADRINGITVLDDQRISITIDAPKSYFPAKLAHPTSFVVDRRTVQAGGTDWTADPNGSGPFEIEQWQNDQVLVIKRNLNYYGAMAMLDRVTFLMGAAAGNPLILYEQGDIDVVGVPAYALARIQDDSNPLSRELVSVPQLSLFYIGLNVTIPPFDDPKVREAFTLLIDREKLAEVSLRGAASPARGILPPGMPGYNSDLPFPDVDVEQARRLIAESRYGSIEDLPPIVAYGSWVGLLRDVLEAELELEIEVRSYERFGDYLDALKENNLLVFGTGWVADYPDPENFLDLLFRGGSLENHTSYANPEVDILLDQAAVATNTAARWEMYQQVEQQILADAVIIPLYHDIDHVLVKPYVRNLELTPMGILDLSQVQLVR